jgi:hypothetical protein
MTTLADLGPALVAVARVLRANDWRHRSTWRAQPVDEHVRYAVAHRERWRAGDNAEDHLAHAAVRCLMAMTIAAEEEQP